MIPALISVPAMPWVISLTKTQVSSSCGRPRQYIERSQ